MDSKAPTPTDIETLQRQVAELEAQLAAAKRAKASDSGAARQGARSAEAEADKAGAQNRTDGGANFADSVRAGGHVIGRDFVQYVTQIVQGGEDPEEAKSVIAAYLQALVDDLAGLNLGEIDVAAKDPKREPLRLADIYVPLDTTLRISAEQTLDGWHARKSEPQREHEEAGSREARQVSALEALAAHRELTLLGKPGSGKSTFGAHVVLALAQSWQGYASELAKLGEHWTYDALLPIRVVLRRFAEQLPPGDKPACAGDLWGFIGRDLENRGYGLCAKPIKYVQRVARHHGALILLDGLDECGGASVRNRVLAAVDEIERSAGPKCRFLLTARPYAWPEGPDPKLGVYALADLDDDKIEHFIRAWYGALLARGWLSPPAEAERKMDDLLGARWRPDLRPLAGNPLLLTLMASLHANRGRLPDDRADLYNESVDLLMLRWNRQIGADRALLVELDDPGLKLSDLRDVLEELAFEVHEESALTGETADAQEGATADIGEDRLVRAFRPLLNNSRDKAAVVVDYIEERAGLLIGQGDKRGERQFAFPHRTFQEYLAACHLAAQEDFAARCLPLARAAAGHWQVVLPLAARIAKAERGATAADELVGGQSIADFRKKRQPDLADWTCSLLAGMQLQEIGIGALKKGTRTRAVAARVADWIKASLPVHPDDGGPPATQRASAGDVLAALGDSRFDPQRFYLPADEMIGFVRVPGDPDFRIGTRAAHRQRVAEIIGYEVPDHEINDDPTPTPEFCIARYPVTVAQFRAFVEATGFKIGDDRALRDPDNRPVRYVDWHEAMRYCRWLNEMLETAPVLDGCEAARLAREGSWEVSLPSELEWEKAARGGLPAAVYSWGDTPDPNRANYDETEIGDTSAVGCFLPNGFELHDMIGNLWEWTCSRHEPYPYHPDDGRENPEPKDTDWLVVRGGSWDLSRGYARCAYRYGSLPDDRLDFLGFRVVLRSPLVS